MSKKISFIFLSTFFLYALYCVMQLGLTWDIAYHYELGKDRLDYLFSLGSKVSTNYTKEWNPDKFYPGVYSTISIFFAHFLSKKYIFESIYIINLIFAFLAVFGIQKISREFFNKQIGKITFVICLFNPIFFGHMGINTMDIPMASAYIWFFYSTIKYLKKQHIYEKKNYYVFYSALALGFVLGIRYSFIIMLIPIFLFIFLEIFYFKILINKRFSKKVFYIDAAKVLIFAYLMMVLFWPETHPNIFLLPIKFAIEGLSVPFGAPFTLYNGEILLTHKLPTTYFLVNLFYKLPEFIILSYLIFFCFFIKVGFYFKKRIKGFYFKIFSILFILIFPNLLLFVNPWGIYDGIRLFLYLIPFICIPPALISFFLYKMIKKNLYKYIFLLLVIFQIFFLFNFFALTPYQYVYLNFFAGKYSENSKKFENDYWGISTKELISKISNKEVITNNSKIKVAVCGITDVHIKYYLKRYKNLKFKIVNLDENFDYIIMNNRINWDLKNIEIDTMKNKTCFDKYLGEDIIQIKRRGLILSKLTKI